MAGRAYYYIDVQHDGLQKYRRIKGTDKYVVEQLAAKQAAQWEDQWAKKIAVEERRNEREAAAFQREAQKETASERTAEAENAIQTIEGLLKHALGKDHAIAWDSLKKKGNFPEYQPAKPQGKSSPAKPSPNEPLFIPKLSLLDRFIKSRRLRKEAEAQQRYEVASSGWNDLANILARENAAADSAYQAVLQEWERRRQVFLTEQDAYNQCIDAQKTAYEERDRSAIETYCHLVLSASEYPDSFPSEYDIEYNPQNEALVVEYSLPSPDAMPRIKEVRYIQNRDDFRESFIPDSKLYKLYDNAIYQIALRSLYELFQADQANIIASIVFNGWVRSNDKATGNETNGCILSVQATKKEFLAINLALVEPKACFKSLKGISSSKLHSLTPVAPILQLNREDPRFINSYVVAGGLDSSTNLAAMDWTDFEHLIRELFEKEFSGQGGEVKVTQASRDGGVDAVAFDPDPVRGGKIVIQAKRYTNTVGVAAVRDLYGTVVNEGANKGILVTTSDYGPDAYEFAKGKPLTLLNGANLLHLLAKHGHRAKIDLKEAKLLAAEKEGV
ncbi:MAG: Mrr restriction system protein [Syntrophorhabdus sp. PtaB.Bin006]|nr:MAG: Mrr restriction system protein [Syntrophorhabdus sp. PtaB.Bin006]